MGRRTYVDSQHRGSILEETISYIERNILGKLKCYLPEAQEVYGEQEEFAKDFPADLKGNL